MSKITKHMNYFIINNKNKKRKININNIKKCNKTTKIYYKKLKPTNIDVLLKKNSKYLPNLYPEYVVFNKNDTLIRLSKKIAQKINLQILNYKAKKSLCFVEYIAIDCSNQILNDNEIDIFRYIKKTYGENCLNKKEGKIFPYLVSNYVLLAIYNLCQQLRIYTYEIEYGAKLNKYQEKMSLANIYGFVKYNLNFSEISQHYSVDYKKYVYNFIVKLSKIEYKLKVCINYIQYLAEKFKF